LQVDGGAELLQEGVEDAEHDGADHGADDGDDLEKKGKMENKI
jgi:hypothetical protein